MCEKTAPPFCASPGRIDGLMSLPKTQALRTLDEVIAHRSRLLVQYQGDRLSQRYADLVTRIAGAEEACRPGSQTLANAAARGYYKFLAIKDEYEVARLHADLEFLDAIDREFEGDYRLKFHLAPPRLAKRETATGQLKKSTYGSWLMVAFKLLSRLRFIRNTFADPFARTQERRFELGLLERYEAAAQLVIDNLNSSNFEQCVSLLSYPDQVRGFGHVREASHRRIAPEIDRLIMAIEETKIQPAPDLRVA